MTQSFIAFSICSFFFNKRKINLKSCWMTKVGSKLFLEKRAVSERILKKTFWNSPFLQKCPWISRCSISKKQKKERKFIQNRLKVSCEQSKGLVRTDKDCRVQSPIFTFDIHSAVSYFLTLQLNRSFKQNYPQS